MTIKRHSVVALGWLAMAAGCGGGGGSSSTPPLPPVASITSNVATGVAPLAVNFNASGSSDPQGLSLSYSWDFGDGTAPQSGSTIAHTYDTHGSYTATVTVSDGKGTATKSTAIQVTAAPPSVQALAIPVQILGVAGTEADAHLVASDREGLPLTYSIASPPDQGTATINATTGLVSYIIPGYPTALSTSFVVSVANSAASTNSTVTVNLNSDPLLSSEWHIQNVGQDSFASVLPVAGNDLNVTPAWYVGYSGKGVKVGVVDSGLEIRHEDLAANVDVSNSYNFLTGTNDPTPTVVGFDHGTQVAGIIGAVAFNNKGGRGVAYNARLRGYNLIAAGAFDLDNFSFSLGGSAQSADNDLFNASFGPVTNALPTFSGAYQGITQTTLNLRGGLGATIVNAAGNDFEDFESASSSLCVLARNYGVSCGDTATDERRGGDTPLVVAALNANGTHASYSSAGSSVWISAPGGEFGLNANFVPSMYSSTLANPLFEQPAIVTTALTDCANAYNPFNASTPVPLNALDDLGQNPFASQCQYTATMNGTSSATPNVSGIIALMLEANPKLSVRDIKYILAKTAKRVDPTFAGVSRTDIIAGSTITLEQGWVTNAGGFTFSNRYGFGGVDAGAAVTMAKAYSSFLPALQGSTGNYQFYAAAPAQIAAGSATGGTIHFAVSEAFSSVEFVVVFLNIANTPALPCNQVEITSPSGTKSILLHAANGFTNTAVVNSRFESNAFYGEGVNGTWTLRFLDLCNASTGPTTLSTTAPQVLLLAGH